MASNRLRLIATTALATTALLALGAAVGGYLVLEAGWYSVAATRQHFQVVHTLLEKGMHESVRFHARDVVVPPPAGAAQEREQLRRGARLYRRYCEQCHGGPGVAQHDIGRSMQPLPGPLVDAARRWRPRELYWITRHGIKMSGMPAWEYRLADEEMWDIVAFLGRLPLHTAASYREVTAAADAAESPAPAAPPLGAPDARRGRIALTQYACSACHKIPGVTGPDTYVGPPLQGLGRRKYVAGVLPNTPDNLVRWIRTPQAVDPQTTMPALGVTERDARDMAAYLLARD
ncbi:cytochrome c [Pseudoduganella flava]|uniref:C-type cytochrome n=1 Tax=Pseudoduganella flava TaxID=871742 RepID=A0A562PQK8_9BURK|nr:c-type cytochrome [Pseudoduganella flava]QGZ37896.1 c-type cytochrome [Pseudoduganella flava]TWI46731.1 cytochrome c [Pseudoduganella flava]